MSFSSHNFTPGTRQNKQDQPMTLDELRRAAPSAFALEASADRSSMRPERQYSVAMSDDSGGTETCTITIAAGTEEEQDKIAQAEAESATETWVRDGDWGYDGAFIRAYYILSDDVSEWPLEMVEVDIDPDEKYLMKQVGGDPYCEHEWTSDGEGGCDENPGVWSTGGTSMMFRSHCEICGLIKIEHVTGSQRNSGEHDTVEFRLPDEAE